MLTVDDINQTLRASPTQIGWPNVTHLVELADGVEIDFFIDPQLPVFAGHFPEQPVLPGIVQVHWAAQLAQLMFDSAVAESSFSNMRGIKFNAMMLPNQHASLKLEVAGTKLKFQYFDTDAKYSNGVLNFSSDDVGVQP